MAHVRWESVRGDVDQVVGVLPGARVVADPDLRRRGASGHSHNRRCRRACRDGAVAVVAVVVPVAVSGAVVAVVVPVAVSGAVVGVVSLVALVEASVVGVLAVVAPGLPAPSATAAVTPAASVAIAPTSVSIRFICLPRV